MDGSRGLLRTRAFVLAVDVIVLIVFGWAFLLIVHGFLMGFIRLSPYWEPAYHFYTTIIQGNSESVEISQLSITNSAMHFSTSVVMAGVLIGFGILIREGYCSQNFFCQ